MHPRQEKKKKFCVVQLSLTSGLEHAWWQAVSLASAGKAPLVALSLRVAAEPTESGPSQALPCNPTSPPKLGGMASLPAMPASACHQPTSLSWGVSSHQPIICGKRLLLLFSCIPRPAEKSLRFFDAFPISVFAQVPNVLCRPPGRTRVPCTTASRSDVTPPLCAACGR